MIAPFAPLARLRALLKIERRPLPSVIEGDLDRLMKETDFLKGEATKARLDEYFQQHRWVRWIDYLLAATGFLPLIFEREQQIVPSLIFLVSSTVFALIRGPLHRHFQLDRYSEALERWRDFSRYLRPQKRFWT